MTKDPLARLAERQRLTAPIEQPVQDWVHKVFDQLGPSGRTVRNLLHGTWLHEPLHSVITDVPIGAWTCAIAFDAIAALGGDARLNYAADASVALGLTGAMAAAITGLNDWADTEGAAKRIGAAHGALNVVAVALFGASLLARRGQKPRTKARVLAGLGYLVVSATAHLGGNLVYEQGVGVQDTTPIR